MSKEKGYLASLLDQGDQLDLLPPRVVTIGWPIPVRLFFPSTRIDRAPTFLFRLEQLTYRWLIVCASSHFQTISYTHGLDIGKALAQCALSR